MDQYLREGSACLLQNKFWMPLKVFIFNNHKLKARLNNKMDYSINIMGYFNKFKDEIITQSASKISVYKTILR